MDTDKHLQQDLPFPTVTSTTEKWACPKCKSENLRVVVKTWANLYQGPEYHETDEIGAAHDWGSDSAMECYDCDFNRTAAHFAVPK